MTPPKKPAKRKPLVAWVHVHRINGGLMACNSQLFEPTVPCLILKATGETCKGWLRFREVRR